MTFGEWTREARGRIVDPDSLRRLREYFLDLAVVAGGVLLLLWAGAFSLREVSQGGLFVLALILQVEALRRAGTRRY